MKALNLYGIGDLRYEDVPAPEPGPEEVLIKVLAAGICGSDVPRVFSKGVYKFPTIIGHEFAGEIVSVGDNVSPSLAGRRTSVFPLLPCFKCAECEKENYASCKNYSYYGSRTDGAFAEYICVRQWNLMLLPDSVPTKVGAMMEPCAVAVHAIGKAGIKKGDTVCIFGAGAIGLILAKLASIYGAKIVVLLDIDEAKLDFARGQGIKYTYSSLGDAYLDDVKALTEGNGADVCIDAAGVPAAVASCFKAARASGAVVLMGNPSGDMLFKQDDYWEILRKQLTLVGTWNSDFGEKFNNDWDKALKYLSSGKLDITGLVTHTYRLDEFDAAFSLVRDQNEFFVKVMFLPNEKE